MIRVLTTHCARRLLPGFAVPLALSLAVVGCTRTEYGGINQQSGAIAAGPVRTVGVEIDGSYFTDFPNCTVILPTRAAAGLEKFKPLVEIALGRHMTEKLSRVVDRAERTLLARQNSLQMSLPEDGKALAKILNCDTVLASRVVGSGHTYLIVWSQVRIGIEIVMLRASDGKVLWQARHVAERSDGGVPLSPVGLVVESYSSAQFSSDGEVAEATVEDAVRRLVRSLPDARL